LLGGHAARFSGRVLVSGNLGGTGSQSIGWFQDMRGFGFGDPSAPTADRARLFARDANALGKMQLCVRFPSGAVEVIATAP
jgi:hypothetical protein